MSESNDKTSVRPQSAIEAFEDDINVMAHQTGRSPEQVRRSVLFEQSFSEYRRALSIRHKDYISGTWIDFATAKGFVRFVGQVPSEVLTELQSRKSLDFDNVTLLENGVISWDDQNHRARLIADALCVLGYRNFATFFAVRDNVIQIELKLPEGTPPPNIEDLVAAIQQQLNKNQSANQEVKLQGRAAIIELDDIELVILKGDSPMVEFDNRQGER